MAQVMMFWITRSPISDASPGCPSLGSGLTWLLREAAVIERKM
ncbi:hypothetical protein MBEBAB_1466 [Brevundimonas abyssalis TAR-001]|uniref:Uncharacterized protein n=1 Tax=Brevundimonas abyssalis TAR-001 TaxID=1391729 RepID=A0A8E0KK43_9CAUL|nr:hypothetical protein MBEBAB_1466 [Brevundimonas abyssalis TAR-001]